MELAREAVVAALRDVGPGVGDVDGFAMYFRGLDASLLAHTLGIPDVRLTVALTGGGGRAMPLRIFDLNLRAVLAS